MKQIVIAVVGLAGCGIDSNVEPFAPDQVASGIYKLTVSAATDTCDPPRYTGAGRRVGVSASEGALVLQDFMTVNGASAYPTYTLVQAAGYASAFPGVGKEAPTCAQPSPSGDASIAYTLVGAAADRVDVIEDEAWTINVPCSQPYVFPAASMPSASCKATRALRYDLVATCAPPCSIVLSTDLPGQTQTCSCDPGA
ncbi:MAG: hypothetical protein ABJE66_26020 [Deltaproteobacteria bacterium]